MLGAPIISLELLNLKSSNFVQRYITSSNRITSPTKGMWLWSRDCFKILPFVVMQRVVWLCQRQLSYLFKFCPNRIFLIGEAMQFKLCVLFDTEEY